MGTSPHHIRVYDFNNKGQDLDNSVAKAFASFQKQIPRKSAEIEAGCFSALSIKDKEWARATGVYGEGITHRSSASNGRVDLTLNTGLGAFT